MKFEPVRLSDIKPNDGHTYIYFHYDYSDSTMYFGKVVKIDGPKDRSTGIICPQHLSFAEYEVVFKQPILNEETMRYEEFEYKPLIVEVCVTDGGSLKDIIFTRITEGE